MILIDNKAPEFVHVAAYQKGKKDVSVSLSDYKGKWVVFFFYPRDFTFICPTELKGFSNAIEEFRKRNCEIVAASTDSVWCHKAWFERDLPNVEYPVLADTSLQIARDYQVLNEANGEAQRGLFLIDPEGIVKYILVSAGSVGRSVSETLRVLEALQSGELCPMEWKPGMETLGKAS
ncbi:peroxiredoxin [Candidatus Uhrbacteria bacterium]|nr:peroxiredoxin [Candidatus Uhrbacteria bacterium]